MTHTDWIASSTSAVAPSASGYDIELYKMPGGAWFVLEIDGQPVIKIANASMVYTVSDQAIGFYYLLMQMPAAAAAALLGATRALPILITQP